MVVTGGSPARRVLCVGDGRMFGELLEVALSHEPDIELVDHVFDVAGALDALRTEEIAVVVIEHGLPAVDGVDGVRRVKHASPGTRVVLIAASPALELLVRSAAAGADGFLARDSSLREILDAIRSDVAGIEIGNGTLDALRQRVQPEGRVDGRRWNPHLTDRERDVLALLSEGLDPQTIAIHLGITVHTSRSYVRNLLAKLGAHTQLEAVITAARCGMVTGLCCCDAEPAERQLSAS